VTRDNVMGLKLITPTLTLSYVEWPYFLPLKNCATHAHTRANFNPSTAWFDSLHSRFTLTLTLILFRQPQKPLPDARCREPRGVRGDSYSFSGHCLVSVPKCISGAVSQSLSLDGIHIPMFWTASFQCALNSAWTHWHIGTVLTVRGVLFAHPCYSLTALTS
jgi:hypothetical protein